MTGLRRCGHPLGPSAHCSECAWEEYRKGPPLVSLHSPTSRGAGSTDVSDRYRQALVDTRVALRGLQPALNVMAREVLDDIIADNIDAALRGPK